MSSFIPGKHIKPTHLFKYMTDRDHFYRAKYPLLNVIVSLCGSDLSPSKEIRQEVHFLHLEDKRANKTCNIHID